MILFNKEAKNLYDARKALQAAKDSQANISLEIEEVLRKHAPSLLTQQAAAEEQVKLYSVAEKQAAADFSSAVTEHLHTLHNIPYGKGKLLPMVNIDDATMVEVEDSRNIGIVASWLVARGMSSCITFKFSPVAFFRQAKTDGTLPRTVDGLQPALSVLQGPQVKIASLENWPELDTWYTPDEVPSE